LAGASTDAAATLTGLNRLCKFNRPLEGLCALGIRVGTDIPLCIYGRTADCRGKGELVGFMKTGTSGGVIVGKPDIRISSPDIFQKLDLTQEHEVYTETCKEALDTGNYELLCNSLSNRLEPISGEMYSEIYKIKENMLENGADGAVMSG